MKEMYCGQLGIDEAVYNYRETFIIMEKKNSFMQTKPVFSLLLSINPTSAPIMTEAITAAIIGSPLFMIIAPDTEQSATREPTLKSIFPLMMIIVMPIATMD